MSTLACVEEFNELRALPEAKEQLPTLIPSEIFTSSFITTKMFSRNH